MLSHQRHCFRFEFLGIHPPLIPFLSHLYLSFCCISRFSLCLPVGGRSSGAISVLGKGRSARLPLYADFSGDILQFTDSGRILGELVIRYSFLGKEREAAASASVMVRERGAFPPGDYASLAAFVSPTAPEVLEFAKNVTGIARNERRTGLNGNMQTAVWLFEGLRSFGPTVKEDGVETAQFPAQTLAYKTGTARDWALLYAACLEASGIGAALVPLDATEGGGFITAVNLGITEAQAATLFDGLGRLLVIDDTVWLPVSAGALNDGFARAWGEAAEKLAAAVEVEAAVKVIILAGAWAAYPSAPFPALGVRIAQADITALRAGAGAALSAYIADDIQPLIAATNAQIRQAAAGALYNRLGLLYVRAGNTAAAWTAFQRAVDMGYQAAKQNLDNLRNLDNVK
jgi:hypothetical protein